MRIIGGVTDLPHPVEPMLARTAKSPPEGEGWAFEIKWDGVRALAAIGDGRLRIASRTGKDASDRYPELTGAIEALARRDILLDGEVVALDDAGRPSFQALQRRMGLTRPETIERRAREVPVTFIAFDVLALDGKPIIARPYEERRSILDELGLDAATDGVWRAPAHHPGPGSEFLAAARAQGLEGIVAKRLGSTYRPGRRSADWVKVRARKGQELVIGAFMPGDGARRGGVGSLLVGHWDSTPAEAKSLGRDQRLVYAGGVGTGFTDEMLRYLTDLLEPLRVEDPPFELGEDPRLKYKARARERGAGPVWVEPALVCEVEFTEWTREGTLRQPSFKGLRDDKAPREVVRES